MPIRDQNVAGNARIARHVASTYLTQAFATAGQQNWPFWAAPFDCTIIRADVFVTTTVATSNTNYWSFQVHNRSTGNLLRTTARTTAVSAGAQITLSSAFSLDVNQNLNVAANEVLGLRLSGTGTVSTLDNLGVRIIYVPRRAGPQGTNAIFLQHNDTVTV